VPGGTIKPEEPPEKAVLSEAQEETGLDTLILCCLIVEQTRDMMDYGLQEWHHRYFYHLRYLSTSNNMAP
jgi:ADP-ribose pyrophosphatase YjhB (NUDIX family)